MIQFNFCIPQKILREAGTRRTEDKSRSGHQVTEICIQPSDFKMLDFKISSPFPFSSKIWKLTEHCCWVSKFSGRSERRGKSAIQRASHFIKMSWAQFCSSLMWPGISQLGKIVLKGCWTPNSCPASKSAHKAQTNCISNFLPSLVTGWCGGRAHYKARSWPRKIWVLV